MKILYLALGGYKISGEGGVMEWRVMVFWILFLLLAPGISHSQTQKFSVLVGATINSEEITYTGSHSVMQFEYAEGNWSVAYLNEGQFSDPKHHRDGFVGQYWLRKNIWGFQFSVGAGPYLFFDTVEDGNNIHGLGGIFSAGVEYPITVNWSLAARTNLVLARDMNTASFMGGVQYSFSPNLISKKGKEQEIAIFPVGFASPNSNWGDNSFACGAEYRWHIGKHLDWTVAFLSEGYRDGLVSQFWAVKKLGDLSLAIGGGVYFTDKVNLIISPTVSYDLTERLGLRAELSRVVDFDNSPNRDSDVVMAGVYLRF